MPFSIYIINPNIISQFWTTKSKYYHYEQFEIHYFFKEIMVVLDVTKECQIKRKMSRNGAICVFFSTLMRLTPICVSIRKILLRFLMIDIDEEVRPCNLTSPANPSEPFPHNPGCYAVLGNKTLCNLLLLNNQGHKVEVLLPC